MKKLLSALFMLALLAFSTSCTETSLTEDENQQTTEGQPYDAYGFEIDPDKDCPPNDRNCNGIPDDEE